MRSRSLLAVGIALAGVMLAGTAAYGFDRRTSTQLLPGTTIGGVAVGGLSLQDAKARVTTKLINPLRAPIRVTTPDGRTMFTSAWDLGLRVKVDPAVARAWRAARAGNLFQRLWWRATSAPADRSVALRPSLDRKAFDAFLAGVRAQVVREALDARLDTSSGWVSVRPDVPGKDLDAEDATRRLLAAARAGAGDVALQTHPVQAKVTGASLDTVILIRTGENKLYLYKGGQIVRSWPVAVGAPKFETPLGTFKIVRKRVNPTWVNPGSDWSKKMPGSIPPGPDNPLGSRAMDINSPGIRIHGTPDAASIGYNASHGCVRMNMADAEALFEMVDVGTPVVIVNVAPPRLRGATSAVTPAPAA